jgi:hypothetical protein
MHDIVTKRNEGKRRVRGWKNNIKMDLELDTVVCTDSFLLRKEVIRML